MTSGEGFIGPARCWLLSLNVPAGTLVPHLSPKRLIPISALAVLRHVFHAKAYHWPKVAGHSQVHHLTPPAFSQCPWSPSHPP